MHEDSSTVIEVNMTNPEPTWINMFTQNENEYGSPVDAVVFYTLYFLQDGVTRDDAGGVCDALPPPPPPLPSSPPPGPQNSC